MRRILLPLAFLLAGTAGFAQGLGLDDTTVSWRVKCEPVIDSLYKITFSGRISEGWHIYPLESDLYPTEFEFGEITGCRLDGDPYEISIRDDLNGNPVFNEEAVFAQNVILDEPTGTVNGSITWMGCTSTQCASPEYYDFTVKIKGESDAAAPAKSDKAARRAAKKAAKAANGGGKTIATLEAEMNTGEITSADGTSNGKFNWGLVLEAILWGFAALLTPCVFPMVPMTVSFFIKGASNPAAGRFKALMYGVFIICLYTIPISIIILVTRIVGGDAVTADIFNWLATHWLPNIIFFIIFMVFAASFFGAFEITMPSKLVNSSDRNSDRKGLGGIFFMALTLVLVSFSCTGPIVGSVLIKATQGEFWEPMVAMLAFSIAFALPFTILAFFPSLLKNLPKSGGWLNSVKVVLGFIEVALGFKFLSVADQTYHWGILDREVSLAIWIVVFTLLGFYLLGKIRFKNDDKVEHVSVLRLALAIAVFAFVVYMIPGMFGAPLKALSGYLPPITTQDFVLGQNTAAPVPPQTYVVAPESAADGQTAELDHSHIVLPQDTGSSKYGLKLPLGLSGYFDLEEALEAAKAVGKPVFVDITGHGCVNCREMESRVWSDPEVLSILANDYIVVALYTDDKQKLEKEDWLTTESGDVLTQLGRKNSYIARTLFGVNAQPNYVLLSPEGRQLAPVRGYNLDVKDFVKFLRSGL
ncbi:MAG: thioredoxin family protein [Bacteroidales bacterium]|nr:thioredoxin family protein [Bacteroidales bacterium]